MERHNCCVNKENVKEVIYCEKEVIRQIIRLLSSEVYCKADMGNASKLLHDYYYEILKSEQYASSVAIHKSLLRVLRFLIYYPIKSNIDIKITEKVYTDLWLIDMVTFVIAQKCTMTISNRGIDSFIDYVNGSTIENLVTFYFYRMSPDYIKEKYYNIGFENLTNKELYYGITTGYFNMGDRRKCAVKHLEDDSATDYLDKLKKYGLA